MAGGLVRAVKGRGGISFQQWIDRSISSEDTRKNRVSPQMRSISPRSSDPFACGLVVEIERRGRELHLYPSRWGKDGELRAYRREPI